MVIQNSFPIMFDCEIKCEISFLRNTCFASSSSHIWKIHPLLLINDPAERPWDHAEKEKGPDELNLPAAFAKTQGRWGKLTWSLRQPFSQLSTAEWSKVMCVEWNTLPGQPYPNLWHTDREHIKMINVASNH